MAPKTTHGFKTIDFLLLHLDIYTHSSPPPGYKFNVNTPVVLFFHGGGIVSNDRRLLPPHIVQSALIRGWPLVSADYRLLPQTKGIEILEDVKDAYAFVRTKLFGILNNRVDETEGDGNVVRNVIVAGSSAGAFWAYQAGHHLNPRPLALLAYYGHATIYDPWFHSNKILTPTPLLQSDIQHFLDEAPNSGFTRSAHQFDPACLLSDLSPNPDWKKPKDSEEEKNNRPRGNLYFWLLQNNLYPELMEGVCKSLDDEAWKDYPRTIIVHGDEDDMAPYQASLEISKVIGPIPAKLFTVKGKKHDFDSGLYLGHPDLEVVKEAWRFLDGIIGVLG